ncbi:PAS domain-containing sensor histidine kinase [Actibacterium ureilyticum]|uniref:PAS domain-containing sensor histidine kinase n=1 Tax=Actibacterium ureilyticum TaxID=1590614 RepID=UPI000BAB11CC|nr:ATP-binding protein [Actibacterium ureilyticum]
MAEQAVEVAEQTWVDVLEAVDKTYAEMVGYQEQLEARNVELMQLRAFLSSIMASISDFLVVTGRDCRITDASASFCAAVGADIDSLIGRDIGAFIVDAHRAHLLATIEQTFSFKRGATVEADLATVDGADPVEFKIAPRLDRRRRVSGVVLTGRTLGEVRRAFSRLEQSHEELKQAQGQLVRNEKLASLGRLLAGVAHELNNPISFVYANTHALEKYLDRFETYFERVEGGAPRQELVELRQELKLERNLRNLRTAIEGARDGSERVRSIVEDLRRLSADGTGETIGFDLTETAGIAANWVRRGTKPDLKVTFTGEAACAAHGRPGHIQQVVMNLVQNAVDALAGQAGGSIVLDLSYEGAFAVLRVCDNGPGIPDHLKTTIFDPFFTTKQVGEGTGLGLSISYKIAEEHGGSLTLVPSQQGGACFRLALPKGERA